MASDLRLVGPARGSGDLLMVCSAGVLWGTGGLAVQVIRQHAVLSPFVISAYRTGIAAAVLLAAVVVLRRGGEVRRVARRHPYAVVSVGLATGAYQGLYFLSVVLVGVTVSTVVSLGTAPVLLAAAEMVRTRRRLSALRMIQIGAASVGLVLVSTGSGPGAGIGGAGTPTAAAVGVGAAVVAGAGFAIATSLGRVAAQGSSPLALTTLTTLIGAVALTPLALVVGGPRSTADPVALALLLYLGVATFALAYALLYAGLRTTSSGAAVLATLLEPVTAALLATVLLDETISLLGVVGIVLVVAAIGATGLVS